MSCVVGDCLSGAVVARTRLTVGINQSANAPQPARAGGEFFAAPATGAQTRYEALRPSCSKANRPRRSRPGSATAPPDSAGLTSAVADFRAGARNFFLDARPGPKSAPGKDAARTRIIALRAQGYSIDEIGAVLAAEGIGLNRTGISEVITVPWLGGRTGHYEFA
jgi:hypothetical protein